MPTRSNFQELGYYTIGYQQPSVLSLQLSLPIFPLPFSPYLSYLFGKALEEQVEKALLSQKQTIH